MRPSPIWRTMLGLDDLIVTVPPVSLPHVLVTQSARPLGLSVAVARMDLMSSSLMTGMTRVAVSMCRLLLRNLRNVQVWYVFTHHSIVLWGPLVIGATSIILQHMYNFVQLYNDILVYSTIMYPIIQHWSLFSHIPSREISAQTYLLQ